MTKAINQNDKISNIKLNLTRGGIKKIILLLTLGVVGAILYNLFSNNFDIKLWQKNSNLSRKEMLISRCEESRLSCTKFPKEWDKKRELDAEEIDACQRVYGITEYNQCIEQWKVLDVSGEHLEALARKILTRRRR